MKNIVIPILLLFFLFPVKAQQYDNLQISLLTVEPRPDYVYTFFGHTALRLHDPTRKIDVVYNWGTFDFDKPNFLWLFIKGETDYFLSISEYPYFYYSYAMRNSTITEQILNIPNEQKAGLVAFLEKNYLPENREYRYNFIFDNCTSRIRDIIEQFCGGTLNYPEQKEHTTFRQLIHEYTELYPWWETGIDCVIGSGADSLVSKRDELWLPIKLKETLDESVVVRPDGNKHSIVLSSQVILRPDETEIFFDNAAWNWPLITGVILFVLLVGILFAAYRNRRRYRFVPVLLFFIAGIGGCIVAITCFISIHPCTWPNWNIIWLHPFHLIGFAGFFFKQMNAWIFWYHRLNFVLLAMFLLGWCFIPQGLNFAFIPYVLCLMLVSGFQQWVSKKKIYMNKWLTTLLALLTVTGMHAEQQTEPPKLVVCIVVDQLRGDYLQYFAPTFGEKGFKRLIKEGLVYHQVDFGFQNLGTAASIATIYTGTYPYYHGIVSDKKFDFGSKREVSIIHDEAYIGNYTSDRYSAENLLSSTVADELKIASEGQSDIFTIAPNAEEAILAAGKYANSAFWLDNSNGKWATTTYYKDVPWYIDRYNMNQAAGNNPERTWIPALPSYNGFPYTKSTQPFKHTISKGDHNKYIKLKQTPFINTEITNLAATFFEYADFGNRSYPDMLAINYYAGDYFYRRNKEEYSIEIQDLYYQLDKEIERLFQLIDEKVGLNNALVLLTSSGYFNTITTEPQETFKPAGQFFPARCTALLNIYLMAIYGHGNWVEGYYNEQIYLNKKLIEDQKVDWNEILRKSSDFVTQFSGIQEVTTSGQWLVDDSGRAVDFRRGMHKKISGDIFIELQPGWIITEENQTVQSDYTRNNMTLSPLFIMGKDVKHAQIHRKIKATEIAPTLTHILRIRPPNGCKETPLQEFLF